MKIVRYEAIAFTNNPQACENSLSAEELSGFNETAQRESTLPASVQSVVEAYLSPDDAQDSEEAKIFVVVRLQLDVSDEQGARATPVPQELLNAIAELIPASTGAECSLDIDQSSWDIAEVEPFVTAA